MTPLLDVAELSKRFPVAASGGALTKLRRRLTRTADEQSQVHAVDDVSFTIAKGETVGLVGESGCGKSTLVRALTRLLDPTAGSIRFATRDLSLVAARDFAHDRDRGRIQMVFQDAGESINPRFTAFDAIADPVRRLKRLSGAALVEKVDQAATQCGLPLELLGRYPHQLSGGQRARVGIARAVAVEPELLILDEPTAALDVSVQAVVLNLLQDLKESLGMSYLFVSHDLNVVRLLCDRVIVMKAGKIVEEGPTERVLFAPEAQYTRDLLAAIPHPTFGPEPADPARVAAGS
jgi:peptide/nickel transport system ATP-binding protein